MYQLSNTPASLKDNEFLMDATSPDYQLPTNESLNPIPTSLLTSNDSVSNNTDILLLAFHGAHDNDTLFKHYPPVLLDIGAACCIIFAIVGAIGNFVSIVALSRSPKLRNATTAFIINLCVADLLFCCFSLPLSAVTFLERDWNYGDTLCKLFPLFRYSNGAVSIFSVIAITVNRYVLVVHPRIYSTIYKPCWIAAMIAAMWIVSLMLLFLPLFHVWGTLGYDPRVGTCSILPLEGKSPKMFLYIGGFGFPSLVFIVCYSRIFCVVRRASKNVQREAKKSFQSSLQITFTSKQKWSPRKYRQSEMVSSNSTLSLPRRDRTSELRVLKIMLVIFITFVLCYFPVSFVKIFKKEGVLPVLNIMGYLGVYFSNCINPIIYALMSEEYRRAYVQLFTRKATVTTSSI